MGWLNLCYCCRYNGLVNSEGLVYSVFVKDNLLYER